MDESLRNKIWTALCIGFFELPPHRFKNNPDITIKRIWIHFFGRAIDTAPDGLFSFTKIVRQWFFNAEWYQIYDFVEATLDEISKEAYKDLSSTLNNFLELEMSAYRIVDSKVADITNEEEVICIEEALKRTETMTAVHIHLKDALAKFTDRKNPDYRNSIKESVSAVEALCQIITGDSNATLGTNIERARKIREALNGQDFQDFGNQEENQDRIG